jgi:hypothetical protein
MWVTFDASGAFNRPSLVKYKRYIRLVDQKYVPTLELSKYVFRFELAQMV